MEKDRRQQITLHKKTKILYTRNLYPPIVILTPISVEHVALLFFLYNDPATTEIYTLPLHDALPISRRQQNFATAFKSASTSSGLGRTSAASRDRKSTRLNSSHRTISYAVFCLK